MGFWGMLQQEANLDVYSSTFSSKMIEGALGGCGQSGPHCWQGVTVEYRKSSTPWTVNPKPTG